MLRSFSKAPLQLPREELDVLKALQPLMHRLYDRIGRNSHFISDTFAAMARQCVWTRHELEVYRKCHRAMELKPRLSLPNSVYIPSAHDGHAARCRNHRRCFPYTLTVGNVQAGEPYQIQLVHDFVRAAMDEDLLVLEKGPLSDICATLAMAARLVHPSAPCVAVLTKPRDRLAPRTLVDVAGVIARLRDYHGIDHVLHVSMADLRQATVAIGGDLCLGPHRISLIYSRYDFSHPFGDFCRRRNLESVWDEWDVIESIENSNAIMSSSLGSRLAHRRRVQFELLQPSAMEQFFGEEEIQACNNLTVFYAGTCPHLPRDERHIATAAIRQVLPEQWALSEGAHGNLEEARALFEFAPDEYVAKNVLRPRTGSDKTQNRHASGGQIVASQKGLRQVFEQASARQSIASWEQGGTLDALFILFQKLQPRKHRSTIFHDGKEFNFEYENRSDDVSAVPAISEVATFGAFLATGPDPSSILVDRVAGIGARTRPSEMTHPLSKELGYGAISAVASLNGSS